MQETADLGGAAVLGGPLSPVGWSVGFIEAPRTNVIDELLNWRRSLGADLQVDDRLPAWPACLRALDPLESPWTTELLVAHGDWTAYLNNSRDGGDRREQACLQHRRHRNLSCLGMGRLGHPQGGNNPPVVATRCRLVRCRLAQHRWARW